jgi:hypothetical protein
MPSVHKFMEDMDADTGLPRGLGQIPLKPKRQGLLEFENITSGTSEPQSFYLELLRNSHPNMSKRKLDQFMAVTQTPGLSKEEFVNLYKRFKQADREDEVVPLLEYQYDPMACQAEMQNIGEMLKIEAHGEVVKSEKLRKITKQICIAVLPVLLLQFLAMVMQYYEIMNVPQIPIETTQVIMTIILLNILEEFVEVKTIMHFGKCEMLRIRASLTTGNVVQLLMRTTQKLEYIERRSLKHFGQVYAMHNRLAEEFLDVPWKSHETGLAKFGQIVAEFLEEKINRGLDISEVIYIYMYTYTYIYIYIYIYIYRYI